MKQELKNKINEKINKEVDKYFKNSPEPYTDMPLVITARFYEEDNADVANTGIRPDKILWVGTIDGLDNLGIKYPDFKNPVYYADSNVMLFLND